ncbi:uncharacterized protein K452DRAFT_303354 [Aplosporella prunicola CBS 121167]|uniref:Methyltransferase type 11 domain-containing protein n=1 Tax=Aplosporella prunicola CBS 121167 TaxID=1176127 RepID=A0A6A6AWI8_9PEZI|nr:uncharacterized protein K452DRAFT_303467 [Aplosporella prunicola CBS 121167]XP_033391411.1 uncharacterized protein K452DRAFT_303354 [Aplosporella prunicola CBS 121167]KAF2135553.1 hypothetical protein K452DRAFT_303467 [Aplosporella prunicola CBS 121167]KAF2135693.1 hypothetical protein K452DRAFT_303354 [Aplosporella prunicola CBS 121167]
MSFTEANRNRFDKLASEYDAIPWQKKMNSMLTQAIRDRLDWLDVEWAQPGSSDKDVRLLDYACGTGLISRALGSHVTTIRGIDLSPNMVEKFNTNASAAGLTPSQMSAIVGDLTSSEPDGRLSDQSLYGFDIAAVGLGFHHFEDILLATKRLVKRLRPGGVLFIIDLLGKPHEEVPKELQDNVRVFGFDEPGMRSLFEEAGLVDFGLSVFPEKAVLEMKETVMKTVFMAKGRKPNA